MFSAPSYLRRLSRRFAFKVFNMMENNGNCCFDKNGEKLFIHNLLKKVKGKNGLKIFFDIGANIGDYSLMLSNKSDELKIETELHLFEPTKACFQTLNEKLRGNGIILNNFGASDENKNTRIFYDQRKSGLSSLYKRNLDCYNISLDKSEEIELRRLDEYITEKKIKHIDFIKIDIEGHELKALEGLGNYLHSNFIDYIQFEYGGANLDSHTSLMEIYKFLTERNFKIAKIMPYGLESRSYSPFMENFNYSNYVAFSID